MPANLVSRDGFSRPVPRQPAHLHTQAESGAYLRDSSRVPRRRPMKPPYAIGSVPSLSGHAVAYRWRCPLKSPDGPAHAGCASGGTYGSSTTNRKSRSPSRPEWLRRRQSRPSCMDAVRGPFARNTTPNSAPYTTESCFVSSGHSARDQTIG